jgi:hypothetical protein
VTSSIEDGARVRRKGGGNIPRLFHRKDSRFEFDDDADLLEVKWDLTTELRIAVLHDFNLMRGALQCKQGVSSLCIKDKR